MVLLFKEWVAAMPGECDKDATRAKVDGCYSCAGHSLLLYCSSQPPSIKSFWTALIWREGVFLERDGRTTHLNTYFEVLILAGVFRSNGDSTESLWDAEIGRQLFPATVSRENFRIISRIIHHFQDYPLSTNKWHWTQRWPMQK